MNMVLSAWLAAGGTERIFFFKTAKFSLARHVGMKCKTPM